MAMYVVTLNVKEFKSCPNETSVIRFARQSNPTMIDRSFNFFSAKVRTEEITANTFRRDLLKLLR